MSENQFSQQTPIFGGVSSLVVGPTLSGGDTRVSDCYEEPIHHLKRDATQNVWLSRQLPCGGGHIRGTSL